MRSFSDYYNESTLWFDYNTGLGLTIVRLTTCIVLMTSRVSMVPIFQLVILVAPPTYKVLYSVPEVLRSSLSYSHNHNFISARWRYGPSILHFFPEYVGYLLSTPVPWWAIRPIVELTIFIREDDNHYRWKSWYWSRLYACSSRCWCQCRCHLQVCSTRSLLLLMLFYLIDVFLIRSSKDAHEVTEKVGKEFGVKAKVITCEWFVLILFRGYWW